MPGIITTASAGINDDISYFSSHKYFCRPPSGGLHCVTDVSRGPGTGFSYGKDAIGHADDEQPKAETPIQGLCLTGNDVEGFGVGTHRVVDSAFKTFEKVKKLV